VLEKDVLRAVGSRTTIDVTDSFVTYAVVAFADKSIYCLGQQPWSVRYAGRVTQAVANDYKYNPDDNNANNESGKFGQNLLNIANPAAIGPEFANPNLEWRMPPERK
jgi:hypothetical protein